MSRRIFLFVLTNILVTATVSTVLSLSGASRYLDGHGLSLARVAIFSSLWGFAGAFGSLALSRIVAKRAMRVRVVFQDSPSPQERELVRIVHALAEKAGLKNMPEVGVYESAEINAFATGPTKSRALVALSTGLLFGMRRSEIEGVIAHEVAHVANGDMVTMTLVQGVVNSFVMFAARVSAFAVECLARGKTPRRARAVRSVLVFGFEILFGLLGSAVVCWVSRTREFRADADAARLAGNDKIMAALEALARPSQIERTPSGLAAMKISPSGKVMRIFSTHPPIESRLARLRGAA